MVCARTGEPADLLVRRREQIGSNLRSLAWLLVFFGPPGWLALLVVLMVSPSSRRWVTFSGVHATFVQAVEAQERSARAGVR